MKRILIIAVVLTTTSLGRAQEFQNGVVVAVSRPGAEAGLEMLKKGGSAVDAAVATAFAMAVTHPAAGNIGGGGFMMVRPAKGDPVCIEYRETAPAAATPTMFKKGDGLFGHRVVGVPGTVRGMELAHQRFGKLTWKTLLEPAIRLADTGFELDQHHAQSLNSIVGSSKAFPELLRVFGKKDGSPWKAGDVLIQPDLAVTMKRIAEQGPAAFYEGPIADQLVAEMQAGGGIITKADLAAYKAVERKPIRGSYRGHDIYGPPPPSSGGIGLVMMLNMLEGHDLKKNDRFSAPTLHLMAEVMRRAYRERARYLGDPAFVKIPEQLTTREYARDLMRTFDPNRATKSIALAGDIPIAREGDSTTHFSVIDKEGMAVSNTYTLEQSYGSRVVVKGAGFLLNNEMMDFNWRPGVTDTKGLIGTDANLIAPGKRMLSSQTPTIVEKNGKVLLVVGSPGGRTIINTVLSVVVSVLDYEMPLRKAVDGPRLHQAWLPDVVQFEGAKEYPQTTDSLRALGHELVSQRQGDAHSIWIDPRTGRYHGVADKRLSGFTAGY